MTPVFLNTIGGRQEEMIALLEEIRDALTDTIGPEVWYVREYLNETNHPLLSEIRSGINNLNGNPVTGTASNDILIVLVCAVGVVGGILLGKILWDRMR